MLLALSRLAADHSTIAVLTALAICLGAGLLIAALRRRAVSPGATARWQWLFGTAVVAGLGVWTTHFMAMIGYRPDLPLSYDGSVTATSAAIGMAAVGVPLAATALVRRPWLRLLLGAVAGFGVGAMHYTGMSALQGCLQNQDLGVSFVAYASSGAILGVGCSSRRMLSSPRWFCILFTLAVFGAHFISITGTTVLPLPGSEGLRSDKVMLSVFTAAGAAILLLGALMTIIAARRFDAQERAHSAILATALHNMSNGLVFIDGSGKLGLFNDRFVDMFGLRSTPLRVGMAVGEVAALVEAQQGTADHNWVAERIDLRLRSPDLAPSDHILPTGRIVEIDSNPVTGGGAVITFNDVTEERNARSEIAELAFNDPLTGLPNRRAFRDRKVAAFERRRSFHLLLVDLDRFKAVNDTFGHGVGDMLLVQVGRRVQQMVKPEGFVARLGGDEIAVLVEGDAAHAAAVAQTIVDSLAEPFVIGDITAAVGCSIGICGADDGTTPDALMQRADIALYEAKRLGRGRVAVYRPGLLEAVAERHRMEADLRQALALGQLHLAYQPVMSLETDEIIGYEALLRWEHPQRGSVSPAVFVPLAEESGLIVEIGRWALEQACREAASWRNERYVAVNVSAVQFLAPHLFEHIAKALSVSGLPSHRLEIELTETALVEDGDRIAKVLSDIRNLGVKIAMDDFGTGYSSLAHLCDFPLDRIKIDRSFVAAAETDTHAHAIVKAVVALGHDIGVPTLAEGIETPSQLELLRQLGCGAVQGYLIGKPGRGDEAAPALKRSSSNPVFC